MSGNLGRSSYSSGAAAPLQTQQSPHHIGNRFMFSGAEGGSRHFCNAKRPANCNNTRSVHTGRSVGGSFRQNKEPNMPHQMIPPSQPSASSGHSSQQTMHNNGYHVNPEGFINGIKKFVNNFISPKLNCDFYSDHHRFYNPKYRNNYMMDQQDKGGAAAGSGRSTVQTMLLNLKNVTPFASKETPVNPQNVRPERSDLQFAAPCAATFGFAIFTSDDFPALPEVKKQVNAVFTPAVKTETTKLPRRRRKCRERKEEPLDKSTPASELTTGDFIVLAKPKIPHDAPNALGVTCQSPLPPYSWRVPPRVRQMSECSDDSFVICFSDEAPEGVLEMTRDSDDSDDDSSVSSSEDESNDETDNHLKVPDVEHLDSGFDEKKDKKVRFNLTPEVHVMHKWDYAYRAARKGEWEKCARDRDRFRKRIDRMSYILNPVLDTQHREDIYRQRFCDSEKSATVA